MKTLAPLFAAVLLLSSCVKVDCPAEGGAAVQHHIAVPSQVVLLNATPDDTVAYFAFGADSIVLPSSWPFCTSPDKLNCSFPMKANTGRALPAPGYLNVTITFGAAVGCGTTKAELNVNNPSWYDVVDVSLVDGYSNDVMIEYADKAGSRRIGPVLGKAGNEKAYGVYPLGCDICVARQNPPCGQTPGTDGCKSGSQYKPDVPCQHQGATMGGGAFVSVALVKPEPAAK